MTALSNCLQAFSRAERPASDDIAGAFAELMDGTASDPAIAGFLMGLAARGETPADIAARARVNHLCREHAILRQSNKFRNMSAEPISAHMISACFDPEAHKEFMVKTCPQSCGICAAIESLKEEL